MHGLLNWIMYKSPEDREKEIRNYESRSFPYGEGQKAKIQQLLAELLPKEDPAIAMTYFLMGKEGAQGGFGSKADPADRTDDQRLAGAAAALQRSLRGKKRRDLPKYLALILADEAAGEELSYPSVEELQKQAEQLASWSK